MNNLEILSNDITIKKVIPSEITDKMYIALAYHTGIKAWSVATSLNVYSRPEDATAKLNVFPPEDYDYYLVELKLPKTNLNKAVK